MEKICDYSCGQEAKYQFKNSKWCCSEMPRSCPEIRKKNSESKKGNKNPMFGVKGENSPVFKRVKPKVELRKLREANIGKKNSILSELNRKKIGINNPFHGKNHTKKTREIMSKNHANFNGKSNPNWKGGISPYSYGPEFNKKLKEYIREKFNHTCILCSKFAKVPHHIDYNKKNNQEDNFVLLCSSCNGKVNKNRVLWEIYFRLYLLVRNS